MRPAAAPLASSCSTPRRRLPPPPAPPLLLACTALLTCTAELARRAQGAANARKALLVAVAQEPIRNLLPAHWKGMMAAPKHGGNVAMSDGRRDQHLQGTEAPLSCRAAGTAGGLFASKPGVCGKAACTKVLTSSSALVRCARRAPKASQSFAKCRGGA